ncbi:MAG: enterochelin esterase [Verrucomicrobia bacterium]|nr:MAG: enterochelin esterase [Verrucomicrobiota bacterium]
MPWEADAAPHFEAVTVPGVLLVGNPLGDPTERRVAVFTPEKTSAGAGLITVYYLPGFGGSSESFLGAGGEAFARVLQGLAEEGLPVRMVVLDCRNRWGGSQYLNSAAQGNYADYVLEEVIPFLEARLGAPASERERLVAGHSSGGFGALRLAMLKPGVFGGVVALSPDTDFEVTHRELLAQWAKNVSVRQLEAYKAPRERCIMPSSGAVGLALGLSAAYAPKGEGAPGDFEWIYDANGKWRREVWERWLDQDPVVLARRNPKVFGGAQKVYLDGPEQDDFGAQKGARALWQVISAHTDSVFFEPRGGHSDYLIQRFARGVEWVFGRELRRIP